MLDGADVVITDPDVPNKPLFSNVKSSSVILVTLIVFLLSPIWVTFVVNTSNLYDAIPSRMGDYSYHSKEITEVEETVDFLFIGSSTIWTSIDHETFQAEWASQTGQEINSLTLAGNWRGDDLVYIQLRDILKRRKVKNVVFSIPNGGSFEPHPASKFIWSMGSDFSTFWSMPTKLKLQVYSENLLITPRLLWLAISGPEKKIYSRELSKSSGTLVYTQGFRGSNGSSHADFEQMPIYAVDINAQEAIYKGTNTEYLKVATNRIYSELEIFFINRIKQLCDEYDVNLVYVKLPRPDIEQDFGYIHPPVFDPAIPVIGLPVDVLFPNQDQSAKNKYFYNVTHMNNNGAKQLSLNLPQLLEASIEKTK